MWSPMVRFAVKQQEEREAQKSAEQVVSEKDFLARFLAALEKDPTIPKWYATGSTCSAKEHC